MPDPGTDEASERESRFQRTLQAIDEANADDPHRIVVRGVERPKELAHAELASEWIERLDPAASEALRLAARAHHLRRWEIPRSSAPAGRPGYLRWRRSLQDLHAGHVDRIMERQGYDAEARSRVADLVRKRGLGRDPEAQALEDALCLVFLETQLRGVAEQLAPEKLEEVLRKTLRKMSPKGRDLARDLPLGEADRALVERLLDELRGKD